MASPLSYALKPHYQIIIANYGDHSIMGALTNHFFQQHEKGEVLPEPEKLNHDLAVLICDRNVNISSMSLDLEECRRAFKGCNINAYVQVPKINEKWSVVCQG